MSNIEFSPSDVAAGAQIRQECVDQFANDPIFLHARATLDKAIAKAPDTTYEVVPSIIQRNREAFAHLKASLSTIRSTKTNSSTNFFSESIPTTRGESTVRALIAVDCVNDNIPVPNPPTSITGNIRPHNPESFAIARKMLLQGTEETIPNHDEASVAFRVNIKLVAGTPRETVELAVGAVQKMIPTGSESKINFRVSDDGAYLIVSVASYSGKKDPLQKLVKLFNRSRKSGNSDFGDNAAATDIFRLGTVRVHIPHDLGEFIHKPDASWITLVEGVRIAFEAITRDNSAEYLKADLIEPLLGTGYGLAAVRSTLSMIGAMECVKENTVNVKIAPAELLFALGVQDAALPVRLSLPAAIASKEYEKEYAAGSTKGDFVREFFASTALEEQVASFLAAKLKLGATSTRLVNFLKLHVGVALASSKGQLSPIFDMLLPVKDMIEEVASASLVTRSGVIDFDIKGINSNIWGWIPSTAQGVLDMAKPVTLAFSPNLQTGETPNFEETAAESYYEKNKEMFREAFKDLIETAAESCFPDGKCSLVTDSKLPVVENAVKKICTLSAPYIRSSAWDLPLPDELTSFETAVQEGRKVYAASRIAAYIASGNMKSALRELPDLEVEQAKLDNPSLFDSLEEESEMRRQFNQFDEDGSGYLERTEAMSAFLCFYPEASPSELLRRLRAADTNEDGKLDFIEFVKIVKATLKAAREENGDM